MEFMAVGELNELSGVEKASMLLMALGTGTSAEVFRHLTEPEIERLSAEIIRMRRVDPGVMDDVVAEFERTCSLGASVGSGGKDFAVQVLSQAVGQEKADRLLQKAASCTGSRPFGRLWNSEAAQIACVLSRESPQIVALVLSHLSPERSAAVLSELSDDLQVQVALRICSLEPVDPEVLEVVESGLCLQLANAPSKSSVSGPKTLVEILNNARRSTERVVLEALNSRDPNVGKAVRDMMFVFEDLRTLDGRYVQIVLRETDQEVLRLALKGTEDDLKELIFANMSERAVETIKEDMELMGPVKIKDIEAAQQKIVAVVRRLLESGQISLADEDAEEQVS
jgi:flagellar motor switch protein FliG